MVNEQSNVTNKSTDEMERAEEFTPFCKYRIDMQISNNFIKQRSFSEIYIFDPR